LETSDLLNNRGEKENICIPYVRVLVVSSLSFTEKGKIGKKILGPIINKKNYSEMHLDNNLHLNR
jgi:hypothetical protein